MTRSFSTASVLTIIAVLLGACPIAQAQVGDATLTIARNGSTLDVSVVIQRIGGTAWKMGTSSFVFNYNSAAMTFDSILTKGQWDASTSALYSPLLSASYGGGTARSVETDNVTTGLGTDVPQTATLVGTLRFTITNFTTTHNITWFVAPSQIHDAAGTLQNVILTNPVDTLGVTGVAGTTLPTVYSLGQNYPNPFNPTTTIGYGLPLRLMVSLTVYNILGEKITELVHGEQEAGYHEVRFDGSNLASGAYFYRLQAGSFVQTRRLMLLR